jgi:antitoxin (DNA-binding transcriptional repressor) of toxin-antitoxin stability system
MVLVSVSDFKTRLEEHLRRVKAGETILVTARGRIIAQLSPPPPDAGEGSELQDLAERGLVRRGRGSVSPEFWRLPRPEDPQGKVLQSLLRERSEGR